MKTVVMFLLVVMAADNAEAQRQYTVEDYLRLYQIDLKACATKYENHVSNGCNGNSYVARDPARRGQCFAEAERRRVSCEQRAAFTYDGRVSNLNRRNGKNN